MSEADSSPQPDESVARLTNARAVSLERVAIRTREGGVTLSGWRLSVESDEGTGAIVLVEAGAAELWYRGEGLMLGWKVEDLRAAYDALRPRADEPASEIPQLG